MSNETELELRAFCTTSPEHGSTAEDALRKERHYYRQKWRRLKAEMEFIKAENSNLVECLRNAGTHEADLEQNKTNLMRIIREKDAEIATLKGKNKALRKKNRDLKSGQKYDTCGECARAIHCSGKPTCADFINELDYIGSEEYQYQESKRSAFTPQEEPES
jgi:predicted RNase H-like nuclease (RuvC/YqgF family)